MVATVMEIIDVQSYRDQDMQNVFHFVDPAGSTDLEGLVDNYIDDVLPLVKVFQYTGVSHVRIRYRQVYPIDTLTLERAVDPPVDGISTSGDIPSSFLASSIKFVPGATVVLAGGFAGHIKRSGARIPIPSQDHIAANSFDGDYLGFIATWFAELKNPGTGAFLLCVASFLDGARARHSTVQSYAEINSLGTPAPSTQNTRKVLRGRTF